MGSTLHRRISDNVTSIVSLLILGAGFIALFAGFNYFFLIWIIGYVVLLPIISILAGEADTDNSDWNGSDAQDETEHERPATDQQSSTTTTDALSTLRERYARGDLTDEQFERKLDRLLETETPETAAEWRKRTTRDIEDKTETETETEFE
ncbi:SHOCT domain-containing protein [Halocatena marina]|uniref:SHOCT domain-containing protein n=1 Tax=Halocatena marina TaxID=2934937 RepID=A0ABD5YNH5_9EURY|nr:SHOCT domain-containing protein [Halocatena marina]